MTQQYWLVKSEPESFSLADLKKAPQQTTYWDGVRNYQARNYLRDSMKLGDGVLYYHSNTEAPAIVGAAKVVREGYPDDTQFDAKSNYFDADATPDKPRWYRVDIQYMCEFKTPLTLSYLREIPELAGMQLLKKGNRLSVMAVSAAEWDVVMRVASF